VFEQCWNVWQAQRDAYTGERPGLRHWMVRNLQDNTSAAAFRAVRHRWVRDTKMEICPNRRKRGRI
jgi:hypothetical protein